ncbi:MAG: 30S ribosomal protein S8, partial [bacterium]
MVMTDPIADMIARIKNASVARLDSIQLPYSTIKYAIAQVLKEEGFFEGVTWSGESKDKALIIQLKYSQRGRLRAPLITDIKRISKPGNRVYQGVKAIPKIREGIGVIVVSTPRGIMSDRVARMQKVGGELLCKV